jgi:hypothetical protein
MFCAVWGWIYSQSLMPKKWLRIEPFFANWVNHKWNLFFTGKWHQAWTSSVNSARPDWSTIWWSEQQSEQCLLLIRTSEWYRCSISWLCHWLLQRKRAVWDVFSCLPLLFVSLCINVHHSSSTFVFHSFSASVKICSPINLVFSVGLMRTSVVRAFYINREMFPVSAKVFFL